MDYTFSQLDALRRAWDRTAGRVQNVALAEHEADMLDNLDLTYIDHLWKSASHRTRHCSTASRIAFVTVAANHW